ncbi:unnamed protein product [Parnassius apollo]|uniref:(apollo) hypothetical protein n=1 Tax=Parnassius apollo TaxID=110799 RepID=A0A8S3XSJ6_PARAO|nr:unnamed protein product [Parnassius apollo]
MWCARVVTKHQRMNGFFCKEDGCEILLWRKKGKADLELDCGFKAADVKIPFYIYNGDKNGSEEDTSKYMMSKTSVEVALERVNMRQKRNTKPISSLL